MSGSFFQRPLNGGRILCFILSLWVRLDRGNPTLGIAAGGESHLGISEGWGNPTLEFLRDRSKLPSHGNITLLFILLAHKPGEPTQLPN